MRHRFFLAALAFPAAIAHASRSGLNNVPNADVSAAGTGVVQVYSTFGEDRKPSFLDGVRLGFAPGNEKIELGFDTRYKPGKVVPAFFNAKWVASHWDKSLPVFAIGVASLAPRAQDRDRFGQPQSYGVFTHDAGWVRVHAGWAAQRRNNAMFLGLDRTWVVEGHKLQLRVDTIEIQGAGQWLGSLGFTLQITDALKLELWESKPSETGKAYTNLKLGWGFRR